MILTQVEAQNTSGDLLTLPLGDASSGFIVKSIDGLDPVDAEIVSSSFAGEDGEQYQSTRRGKRNIVMKLGYQADFTSFSVRQLRQQLYNFFMPKSQNILRFYMDDPLTVEIAGRVESFSSPLFAKDPEATISIINVLPDFVDPTVVHIDGMTVNDQTEQTIAYPGTSETGFVFRLMPDRGLNGFTIYNRVEDGTTYQLEFDGVLYANDILEISTVQGSKYARVTHLGVQTSLLFGVTPFSAWINLWQGDNNIRVVADGDPIPFTIDYTTKYGGL